MSEWVLIFEKRSVKDAKLLKRGNLWSHASALLEVLRENPFKNPPPYEKLGGKLRGKFSRRINKQHRLVYQVKKDKKLIRILQMWTHYE